MYDDGFTVDPEARTVDTLSPLATERNVFHFECLVRVVRESRYRFAMFLRWNLRLCGVIN